MKKIAIANAFSLNMLDLETAQRLIVTPTSPSFIWEDVQENGGIFTSIVGHEDTAAILSEQLGFEVPCNRTTFQLEPDTTLYVGQYKGPRLPEGTKTLPEGAKIEWIAVWLD